MLGLVGALPQVDPHDHQRALHGTGARAAAVAVPGAADGLVHPDHCSDRHQLGRVTHTRSIDCSVNAVFFAVFRVRGHVTQERR
eukprot:5598406-Prymnesium_polylepis.2